MKHREFQGHVFRQSAKSQHTAQYRQSIHTYIYIYVWHHCRNWLHQQSNQCYKKTETCSGIIKCSLSIETELCIYLASLKTRLTEGVETGQNFGRDKGSTADWTLRVGTRETSSTQWGRGEAWKENFIYFHFPRRMK